MTAKANTTAGKTPKTKRKRYSPKEKGKALAYLDMCGGNVAKASRHLKIPHQTLLGWDHIREGKAGEKRDSKKAEIQREADEARMDLADRVEQGVRELLGLSRKVVNARVTKKELLTQPLQPLWTSLAIGVDKVNVLRNKPTAITGTTVVTADSERAKYEALVNRIMEKKPTNEQGEPASREEVIKGLIERKPEIAEWLGNIG